MTKDTEKTEGNRSVKDKFVGVLGVIKSKIPSKWEPYFTRKNVIIAVVVLFFLIQYAQVSSVTGGISSLSSRGSSLVDEVGKLNEMTNLLAQDLTEVRGFLLMPTHQYASIGNENGAGDSADSNSDELQVALFRYVNFLGEQEGLKQRLSSNLNSLKGVWADSELIVFLNEKGLSLSKLGESNAKYDLYVNDIASGSTVAYFYLEKETGILYRKTVDGLVASNSNDPAIFASDIRQFLTSNLSSILSKIKKVADTKSYIVNSFATGAIMTLLATEKLSFVAEPQEKENVLYYDIKNSSREVVAQIAFNKKDLSIGLIDSRDDNNVVLQVTDLATALPPFINKLDVLPAVQKNIIESQLKLKDTFEDNGFKLLLEQRELYVETLPREDDYRYFYDVRLGGSTGTLLGSIVIEKSSGMIEVVDPSGAGTTNLLFFEEGLKKKI